MTDADRDVDPDTGAKRLVVEILATLVNIKKIAAQQLLMPAGVPADLVQQFLNGRSAATGAKLTKREAAAMILDELSSRGIAADVVRKLVEIGSEWDSYHLAADEYAARGIVQKAREMRGQLARLEAEERAAHEAKLKAAAARARSERREIIRQQSPLLLAQFDAAAIDKDVQKRGYFLQEVLNRAFEVLNRAFDVHGFPVQRAFQRNAGGEQIDGAIEMDGWHYLVECRWRTQLANIRELDGLSAQVGRSGHQTMGIFLSINGWSSNVPGLLKQNGEKRVVLMDGMDLRAALSEQVDLRAMLKAKLRDLNLRGEPYLAANDLAA